MTSTPGQPPPAGNFEQFLAGLESMMAGGGLGAPAEPVKYIGVPENYAVPKPTQRGPFKDGYVRPGPWKSGLVPHLTYQTPRYTEADILAPRLQSAENIAVLQAEMAKVGLFGKKPRFLVGKWDEKSQVAYEKLLAYANQGAISDREALIELSRNGGAAGLFGDEEEEPFTGSKKQTSKSVNLTDPTSARSLLRATLRDKLGRAPKKDEFSAFLSALNGAERNSASVTSTTTDYVEGEATGSSSVTSGGMNPSAFAEEFAQQGALGTEANTFMVATDYYNAALQALQSPVDI